VLAAVGLNLDEVVADAFYGVRTGLAEGVRQGFVEIHLGATGERALIVMVAKYSRIRDFALNEGVDDLEQSLS
jgi:hypothetical protein